MPISSINSLLIPRVQVQQPDRTYRIGSYCCCENVIKVGLWLVDSVNGEIAGRFFLHGFLFTTAV